MKIKLKIVDAITFRDPKVFLDTFWKREFLVTRLNSLDDHKSLCSTRSGIVGLGGGTWFLNQLVAPQLLRYQCTWFTYRCPPLGWNCLLPRWWLLAVRCPDFHLLPRWWLLPVRCHDFPLLPRWWLLPVRCHDFPLLPWWLLLAVRCHDFPLLPRWWLLPVRCPDFPLLPWWLLLAVRCYNFPLLPW